MSLSVARSPIPQRQMVAEAQFVSDLAALLTRSGATEVTSLGHLLSENDGFRSRLFTLCTAISHMSDRDLSGEQLVELLGKALGLGDEPVPEDVAETFRAGMEAWNLRGLTEEDVWPSMKKPAGSVTIMPAPEPVRSVRPAGVRTLQEALGVAQIARAEAMPAPDSTSLTLEELNALLAEIEERLQRLRPATSSPELPSLAAREAAFLERHPYLLDRRARPVIDQIATPVETRVVEQQHATPHALAIAEVATDEQELRLIPRSVSAPTAAGPPRLVTPEAMRWKSYLALAVVICIGLVATPICAVLAYRYMHPLYIYPAAAPAQTEPVPSSSPADQSEQKNSVPRPARRAKPTQQRPKPAFEVFPAQPTP